MKLILTIVASALTVCLVRGESCPTPSGGQGRCIPVLNCPHFVTLLNNRNRTPQQLDLLRKSQCGYEGSIPKVCCPETCYTPDGEAGRCVAIESCPHLYAMLQPPYNLENFKFVQNSRCNGSEQHSVCCGSGITARVEVGNCKDKLTANPPDPRTECCGIESGIPNKIIGGEPTSIEQYPWLTLIEYIKDSQIKLFCGGALISSKYVLTAAHCVIGEILKYGTPLNVRLGEYDTSHEGSDCVRIEGGGKDCTDTPITIPIERSIPHIEYNPVTQKNDIALIRLKQSAPYTDFIRPICLPSADITLSPPPNFRMFVSGWGSVNETTKYSDKKLHVSVPYVNRKECEASYNQLFQGDRRAIVGSTQLCAGGEVEKDACKGDSGGPLVYQNRRIYEAIGVVSYGPKPCGINKLPGVYTKVYDYKTWILNNIQP